MSDIKLPPLPLYSSVLGMTVQEVQDYARQCVLADRAVRGTVSDVNAAYAKGREDGWNAAKAPTVLAMDAVIIGRVVDEDSYGPSIHFQGGDIENLIGWRVAILPPIVVKTAPTQECGADDD